MDVLYTEKRKQSSVHICHQPEQNPKQTAKITPDQTPRVVHHRGKEDKPYVPL